jgi:importin-5
MARNEEMIEILNRLMSPKNEIRKEAEEYFIFQQDHHLVELISHLMNILTDQEIDLMIRSLCGILLRRVIDTGTVHGMKIDEETLAMIRNGLLVMWANESNSLILRRISHIIAQTASSGSWLELIPSLLSHGTSLEGNSLIALLQLLEIVADYCPDDILTHLSGLVTFLGPYLMSPEPLIQIACAKTVGACIVSVQDDGARDTFKPALQLIIRTLGTALNQGEEIDAVVIMEYLVTIAQHQPMFFKGAMDNIVEAMVAVAASEGLEFSSRSIAVELMVTLTETAPALARRCAGTVLPSSTPSPEPPL